LKSNSKFQIKFNSKFENETPTTPNQLSKDIENYKYPLDKKDTAKKKKKTLFAHIIVRYKNACSF
jgi:hypothetical protein